MNHCRPEYSLREQHLTCCNCAHPLDDNQRMKDGLVTNTTASWAKTQLKVLAEMAEDHGLPEFYSKEARRILGGIKLMPSND